MNKKNIVLTKDKVLQFLNHKKNQDIGCFDSIIEECIEKIEIMSQPKFISDKQEIVLVSDNEVILKNGITLKGNAIKKLLEDCVFAIITVATIGYEADKRVMALQKISPSKALVMNAAASAMVETLTDTLHKEIIKEYGQKYVSARFSPGYKDLPLKTNKDIVDKYNLTKKFGILINDSYLMSPSKTITAITGIKR
ncbi:MAG: hypothetical protein ACOCWI_04395 [Bacillota bacterium]